ncbi:MAG TPA: DUF1552 domain-containing protein [Abditibacteriaceae bacterium]|nr:DUF1552 domain-containing protein [Abditibacteriaceae bacterium]
MSNPLSRRTFLRGVGTAMALPLLEGMVPSVAAAAQAATTLARSAAPTRMVFLFVPNGMHMADWTPATEGAFELPYILEPLKNVKDSISILSGLAQKNAAALGDGPGDHARSGATWLTGVHPRKTAGADIQAGISVDQLAAKNIGQLTRFPSLELGVERGAQAGNCDSGYSCAYSSSISWRGESTPVAKEINPRLVFDRLFGNGNAGEAGESRHRRDFLRKSILDFVLEDAHDLKGRLGVRDGRKLDEYLAAVRELEQRVARAGGDAVAVDPAQRPTGTPADPAEHIRLLGDMMVLALQTDSTRICTFMLGNDGSNRSYRNIGISEGHHELSHHGGDKEKQEKVRQINRFHAEQLAYILEKMESLREGERTLLDNTMVVYGAGISDGDRHNHDNLPILLAGKAGGAIKSGRHIRYADQTPMSNLFLSMLDRVGVREDAFGDSTGRLERLF